MADKANKIDLKLVDELLQGQDLQKVLSSDGLLGDRRGSRDRDRSGIKGAGGNTVTYWLYPSVFAPLEYSNYGKDAQRLKVESELDFQAYI